jgi:hypothetical protein
MFDDQTITLAEFAPLKSKESIAAWSESPLEARSSYPRRRVQSPILLWFLWFKHLPKNRLPTSANLILTPRSTEVPWPVSHS